jgi:EAL domain-containing protein (putative c-di-GMP-specific phosphodiesterase class I)
VRYRTDWRGEFGIVEARWYVASCHNIGSLLMGMPAADCQRVATFGGVYARHLLVVALLLGLVTGSRAAIPVGNIFESQSTVRVLEDFHGILADQLAKLTAAALALAVADDTNEFMSRPNLPYVSAHFTTKQLAADRIDTVLIINTRGDPLFWRRLNQSLNRGFPDARAFLAELPRLPAPDASGMPGIAGSVTLKSGATLMVVAMPVHAANGKGRARGWLIVARAQDVTLVQPYGGLAESQFQGFGAADSTVSGSIVAGSIVAARQLAGVAVPATLFTARPVIWIALLLIISGVVAIKSEIWSGLGGKAGRLRVSVGPIDSAARSARPRAARYDQALTRIALSKLAPGPESTGVGADPVSDALRARISAANAVFRYQPQIDLRTGEVAGVEALLCVPSLSGYQPATELAADIEKAGLGLKLFECRLQEACRGQRTWLRNVGHDFAVGVPVSRLLLANAALLPLVQRVLAEYEIAPALIELEVEEAVLGACLIPLRTLTKVREAGISIALDGFNANHSNLRLLAILPIAKLRVDPWLLLRMADRVAEAQLFAGILGAARGLGIAVCATGVSSADILAAVLQHGRPLAQGAAVAASLDGPEFLERLRGSSVDTVTIRSLDPERAFLGHDSPLLESFKDRKISGFRSRSSSEAASYS